MIEANYDKANIAASAIYKVRERQIAQHNEYNILTDIKIHTEENKEWNFEGTSKQIFTNVTQYIAAHNELNTNNVKINWKLYQENTNKMPLILERTRQKFDSFSEDHLVTTVLSGKMPFGFDYNISPDKEYLGYTSFPQINVKMDPATFYGSVNLNIATTVLLSTTYLMNLKEHLLELESPLIHQLKLNPNTRMPEQHSIFINSSTKTLSVINGGYAYGGMRKENKNWHNDPQFGPEDCSTFVAKLYGLSPENTNSTELAKLPKVSVDRIEVGDIWVISGHTGVVIDTGKGNDVILAHATRDIELYDRDGIGIGPVFKTLEQSGSRRTATYVRPEQKHLSQTAWVTPLSNEKDLSIELSGLPLNAILGRIDAKYFSNELTCSI